MNTRPHWGTGRVRLAGLAALAILSTTGFAFPPPPDAVREAAEALGVPDLPAAVVPTAAGEDLKGLFRVDAANCGGGATSGTYFRMIQPGGSPDGPFIENNSSACADKTYTDLQPGKDGGLSTVAHQPHPDPAFDAGGNGVADRITMPKGFFGPNFSTATNSTDPQTSTATPVPTVTHDGAGKLGGNMSAFAAAYQRQHFNQGAPKPDGSNPGLTAGPTGTYDAASKRYTLEWSSTIVGGPFNNFTGRWHLEGTFEPAGGAPAQTPKPDDGGGDGLLGLPLPLPGTQPSSAGGAAVAPAPARLTAGQAAGELKGLFRLTAASCAGGTPSGTYFRMIQPDGSAADGPYLSNTSSTCSDKSYTDMQPGTEGGLSTVAFQPQPDPPFTSSGGSQEGANNKITQPKEFFGSKYATATNPTDPQTSLATMLPKIVVDSGGKLTGDMRAFAAAYQGQHFNQGAPKPDGSTPGATTLLSGTYDAATKKFSMEWTSTIVGGPFDNFTGKWHFEGVFEPAATPTTPTTPPGPAGTTGGSGTSTLPATNTGGTTTGQVAGTGVTARTGPPWPAALPATLLVLSLAGRRLSRRPKPTPPEPEVSAGTPGEG